MRGTLRKGRHQRLQFGIIPAYAGNTKRHGKTTLRPWDHPRVCGEHPRRMGVRHVRGGSSPRMRGTLALRPAARGVGGIIPAYAGNTIHRRICKHHGRDHPRVCGEHMSVHFYAGYWQGSSPRMRGTLSVRNDSELGPRIIPAYAGNTEKVAAVGLDGRDHPRVCGEHLELSAVVSDVLGSSPRMRGTPFGRFRRQLLGGIIPAYAGNTRQRVIGHAILEDHPRVCGEHEMAEKTGRSDRGSSPRMRGTPDNVEGIRIFGGIIPAYAGNTSTPSETPPPRRDHPRVCGEHSR